MHICRFAANIFLSSPFLIKWICRKEESCNCKRFASPPRPLEALRLVGEFFCIAKVDLNGVPRWPQHGSKMAPTWFQNGPKEGQGGAQ